MGFIELITKVQSYSGFSDTESRDAIEMMVESLAVRLGDRERLEFASQLPEELQAIALSVYPSAENSSGDLVSQFMEMEHIEEPRAREQIFAAWKALKETISEVEVNHLKSLLSPTAVAVLH